MTQAEITHAQMVSGFLAPRRIGNTLAVYEREISVRYTVNGTEYTTDFKLPAEGSNKLPEKLSRGVMASAPDSEHIIPYYNPENPREVVLHPGNQATAVFGMAFGGTATVVYSMFIFALASWLSKPSANG